eukprot:3675329-Rhodomonas_salina.1
MSVAVASTGELTFRIGEICCDATTFSPIFACKVKHSQPVWRTGMRVYTVDFGVRDHSPAQVQKKQEEVPCLYSLRQYEHTCQDAPQQN